MKVHLFTQCMNDMFYPEVGKDAVEVLERLGCEIVVPKNQVCCGQPLINSGYVNASKSAMKNTIQAFEDAEVIVSLSGSCAFAMRDEYPRLLADEPQWALRAERVASKLYEFTQFIVDVLGVEDVGARFPHKVCLHKSCHSTRLLGVKEQPLKLLENVKDLEFVELANADRCCGFGGTFSVKQPDISEVMVAEKAQEIVDSGADVCCGADSACLFNIQGRLDRMEDMGLNPNRVKTMHIASILNSR